MTAPRRSYITSPEARDISDAFADNVNAILAARAWTQGYLAQVSGVPKRTIENMLAQLNSVTLPAAVMVARALDVSLSDLTGQTVQFFIQREGQPVLQCHHTDRHMKDSKGESRGVCPACLSSWSIVQQRKSAKYVDARIAHRSNLTAKD